MGVSVSAAIEARDIRLAYGERIALDGFSLDVPAGVVFGLLGPNGSGKSTFITLLAAMEEPEVGSLRVLGEAPSRALRARAGTVFQENALDPLMSVDETLHIAGRLFGMSSSSIRSEGQRLLGAFGLAARAHDPVSSLSGGMRRRLEMARALLHDPELLLLDEPTVGVDPDERRALWDALLGSSRGRRTILLATNDLAEADAVCERVAFVRTGKVIAEGTPEQLKRGLKGESVRVRWEPVEDRQIEEVRGWPGVGAVTKAADEVLVAVDDSAAFVPRLFELAPHAIREIRIDRSSLEDAYFHHVGQRARPVGEPV